MQEKSKKFIPYILCTALFMELMDATVLNIAIPTIAYDIGIDPISLKIAIASYIIGLAVFIPISGYFADRFGTKNVFISAMCVFLSGSIICAQSSNLSMFVTGRVVQGIGASMMMPVGRLILLYEFEKKDLAKANTIVVIPSWLAPIIGPIVGAAIIAVAKWQWIFYVNIPVAIFAILFAACFMKNHYGEEKTKFDKVGFVFFGLFSATLTFIADTVSESYLTGMQIIVLLTLAIMSLAVYRVNAKQIRSPLLKLSLLKIRTFKMSIYYGLGTRVFFSSIFFLLPIQLQIVYKITPMHTALYMGFIALGSMFGRIFAIKLLKKYNFKGLMPINLRFLALSMLLLVFISHGEMHVIYSLVLFIVGFCISTHVFLIQVLIYSDIERSDMSKATSIGSMAFQLSMSYGIAFGALLLRMFEQIIRTFNIDARSGLSFELTYFALAMLVFFMSFTFKSLKNEDGAAVSNYKHNKEDKLSA